MSEHEWTESAPRLRVADDVGEALSVNTAVMIRIVGGTFRMGSDKHYPEGSAGSSRHRQRFLDRSYAGH
jgi:hypothetical protein